MSVGAVGNKSHYHLSSQTRSGHIPKAQLWLASQSWLLPGKEGVCKHSGVSFSTSVLPERFEESPLSKSLWGPGVVPLQARGSQEG